MHEPEHLSNALKPTGLKLHNPGILIYGSKCSECGANLYKPKAGFEPSVCSSRCRVRKSRRLRKQQ